MSIHLHIHQISAVMKPVVDFTAVTIGGLTLVKALPPLAALLSILWLVTRFYEYGRWLWRGRIKDEKP